MRTPTWLVLASLGPLLAACGDAGGGVNSVATVPPPVAPSSPTPASPASANITTFSSPATRQGAYDTIALIDRGRSIPGSSSNRLATPGEIRITTYQPTANVNELSYTLEFATTELSGGKTSLTAVFPPRVIDTQIGQVTERFGDQFTYTYATGSGGGSRLVDDSTVASTNLGSGKTLNSQLDYSTGLSYVSLGQWNWWITDNASGNTEEYNSVYFVHGDRTLASDVPVSGTATYIGQSLGFSTDAADRGSAYGAAIDVSLTANFAQRSIAAQLNRASWTGGDAIGGYTSVAAVDLHGTGAINAPGTFTIPLVGTVDTTPVTGSLDGAFFGPGAQQVGGIFAVGATPGQSIVRDAFIAARTGP